MCEEQHVARTSRNPFENCLGPGGNLFDALPSRNTVSPKRPSWPLDLNLRSGTAFVGSVVPLRKIRVDDRAAVVAGEPAGLAGPLEWADQHQSEMTTFEEFPDL